MISDKLVALRIQGLVVIPNTTQLVAIFQHNFQEKSVCDARLIMLWLTSCDM